MTKRPGLKFIASAPAGETVKGILEYKGDIFIATEKGVYFLEPETKTVEPPMTAKLDIIYRGSNRRTGRTTGMLIRLAAYIHANYNKPTTVHLYTHTRQHGFDILRKLVQLFTNMQYNKANGYVSFGQVKVFVICQSEYISPRFKEQMAGYKLDAEFADHYWEDTCFQKLFLG